jgi:FKBP-type peptidyl-prolyl cis-trans isomerase FklB
VGSKWQLFIPPRLAYGQQGTDFIGPNETLILEVELVAIK